MAERGPKELDPTRGVFRWSWRQVANHPFIAFLISGVVFAAFSVIATAKIPAKQWGLTSLQSDLAAVGMAAVAVLFISLLYAVLGVPYEQRRSLRRQLKLADEEGKTGIPELVIETGNGEPWDDPRYGPQPKYVVEPSPMLGNAAAFAAAFGPTKKLAPNSPKPLPSPPAPEHSKRFRVTNIGNGKAIGCRAAMTKPLNRIVRLKWDQEQAERFDLAPGEHEFIVLPAVCFPRIETYQVEITLFADNIVEPTTRTFTFIVGPKVFPTYVAPIGVS